MAGSFKTLLDQASIKGVIIRNDNGQQFIANQLKNFLRMVEVELSFLNYLQV